MCIYLHSAEEEEVVPQKLKKSAKQMETKTSKDNLHVKERYSVIVFFLEQLLTEVSLSSVLLSLRV